jgi:pentatricopeptide repeat protein
MFGVSSLPGWQLVSKMLSDNEEGTDAESAIWRRLGGNGGDLLGHGVLSNLPKLFGGDGVDLYSRGDVSVRQLQIQDMDSLSGIINSTIPAMNVVGKVYSGLTQGASLFLNDNPGLSKQQFAEVFSNMLANRPLSGLIEQAAAGGKDTDKAGQLVSETRNGLEAAYRLLGVRSMRQSEELRAFYTNKNAQAHKAANDEQLKLYTRALMREGRFDEMPDVFNQYMKNGGDPRHFRRWMKTTYIAATSTRGERQLEQLMKDPSRMEEAMRLMDAGVSISEDEAIPAGDRLYVANETEEPLTQSDPL